MHNTKSQDQGYDIMKLFKNIASIAIGTVIFLIWLQLVGNPHVVETVLGLVLATAGAIYVRIAILNKLLRD